MYASHSVLSRLTSCLESHDDSRLSVSKGIALSLLLIAAFGLRISYSDISFICNTLIVGKHFHENCNDPCSQFQCMFLDLIRISAWPIFLQISYPAKQFLYLFVWGSRR